MSGLSGGWPTDTTDAVEELTVSNEAKRNAVGLPPAVVSVGLVSTRLYEANPKRLAVVLNNNGPQECFLGYDNPAVVGSGLSIAPGEVKLLGVITRGTLDGIVPAAMTDIAIQEFETQ